MKINSQEVETLQISYMDKKAFKQRMQNLKAYRESNPGKTYLDWKVSAFADGGEVPPTNRPEPIERIPYKGKLYTDKYGQKYTEEQYYDYINNSTDEISKFDNRPMVRGLKPITNLEQAGVIDNYGQISIPIFDKSKFESPRRLKQLYPKTYDKIQNYLLNDSEIKSHMNAFRTYLRDNNMLNNSGKETLNSFKRKLFNSDFDNLKKIFNSYKSGKQFIQDFNMVPVTRIDDNNNLV